MSLNDSHEPIPSITLPDNFAANGLSLAEIVPLHDEAIPNIEPKTEPVVTFDHSNITIPNSFAEVDVDVSNLELICNHIESNLDQLPSNPLWSIQSDIGFEICQESIKWIYDNKGTFPFYYYFPNVKHLPFDFKDREKYPLDLFTIAHLFKTRTIQNPLATKESGWHPTCGIPLQINARTLLETVTKHWEFCLAYQRADVHYSKEVIEKLIKENEKGKGKVKVTETGVKIDRRCKPKKDVSAFEEARIAWKEAVNHRKQVELELNKELEELDRAWQIANNNKKEILTNLSIEIASLKAIMQAESLKLK